MPGERRGRGSYGRAIASALEETMTAMQTHDEMTGNPGLRRNRVATAAVLLAIVVSLAGACVVIVETTEEPPLPKHLTIAAA